MSPRKFAFFIVAMLVPGMIWGFVFAGSEDLLLKTRSLMGQARRNKPGVREGFLEQLRLPTGDPAERDRRLQRLWEVLRACVPEQTSYAGREPVLLEDGREHEHRQVLIRGRSPEGQAVEVRLDWVRFAGKWYIGGFSGWEPPASESADLVSPSPWGAGRPEANAGALAHQRR